LPLVLLLQREVGVDRQVDRLGINGSWSCFGVALIVAVSYCWGRWKKREVDETSCTGVLSYLNGLVDVLSYIYRDFILISWASLWGQSLSLKFARLSSIYIHIPIFRPHSLIFPSNLSLAHPHPRYSPPFLPESNQSHHDPSYPFQLVHQSRINLG